MYHGLPRLNPVGGDVNTLDVMLIEMWRVESRIDLSVDSQSFATFNQSMCFFVSF